VNRFTAFRGRRRPRASTKPSHLLREVTNGVWLGRGMTSFADMTAPPRQIDYLDAAASSATGRDYKEGFLAALDVRAGHAVLDVGCGPGTDLAALASAVTPTGAVIGVDRDEEMLARARQRLTGQGNVDVRRGDAHELPVPDSSVDRARADRVLQHLENPARAVAEMRRVLRPGGVVGLAEPDWNTAHVLLRWWREALRARPYGVIRCRNSTVIPRRFTIIASRGPSRGRFA
jgi:ubiquinone/menaquinone biosynthesis C-methylase UbiE